MKGVYPFHDGHYEDFARVFDYLIKVHLVFCKIQPPSNTCYRTISTMVTVTLIPKLSSLSAMT